MVPGQNVIAGCDERKHNRQLLPIRIIKHHNEFDTNHTTICSSSFTMTFKRLLFSSRRPLTQPITKALTNPAPIDRVLLSTSRINSSAAPGTLKNRIFNSYVHPRSLHHHTSTRHLSPTPYIPPIKQKPTFKPGSETKRNSRRSCYYRLRIKCH